MQRALLDKLLANYITDLEIGWQINLEDLAEMLACKKGSLQRLIKTLEESSVITYQPPFRGTEVHILKRVPKQKVELDFTKLKDKVAAAYDKLDKMENYIYHKNCRQKYLLDYFGDWETQACGKCDICLYGNYLRPKSANSFDTPNQSFKKLGKSYQASGKAMEIAAPTADSPLSTKLTQLQTFELYIKGLSVDEIAVKRELTVNTIINHLCYLLEKNLPINIDNLVSIKKQDKIKKEYNKAKTDKLKELKELLGDDYSYDEIKLALAKRK
ncbi:MAG: helix-turn-helix domain-containing protein [bacterium]